MLIARRQASHITTLAVRRSHPAEGTGAAGDSMDFLAEAVPASMTIVIADLLVLPVETWTIPPLVRRHPVG